MAIKGLPIKLKDFKPSQYITQEVLDQFEFYMKKGDIEKAIDWIADFYPQQIAYKVIQATRKTVYAAIAQELTEKQIGQAFSDLNMIFDAGKTAITEGTRLFTTEVIADSFFKQAGLTNVSLQDKILNSCLGQFEEYINGAMSNTQASMLADIRSIQRDWITRNVNMRNADNAGDLLYKSEAEFKDMLQAKYPNLYNAIDKGEILRSRSFLDKDGNETYMSYTLDEYNDFSVRATILNVDRNSVEIAAHENNEKVVELYLRDDRELKTQERDICRRILEEPVNGLPLLALTEEAGAALGIMTIDQAREAGCMYIHCRHSIRPVSDEFNQEIEKIIGINETAGSEEVA